MKSHPQSKSAAKRSLTSALALALGLFAAASQPAQAALIELTFDFSGGFNLSKNGAPAAPSGALVFNLTVDNATPDLDASISRGRFALTSINVTAAALGISNQAVISPSPLYVDTFSSGMTIIGAGFNPDIGWNGGPAPSTFMGNINNLGTLPLPTSVTMTSTFFLQTLTLANGDTLSGGTGNGGPSGTFSARLAGNPVPDSSFTLTLFLGSMMLMAAGLRWRKNGSA